MYATTCDDDQALSLLQQASGRCHGVRGSHGPKCRRPDVAIVHVDIGIGGLPFRVQHVVGNDEGDRARAATRGNPEGGTEHLRQRGAVRDVESGLGDRGEEPDLVEALRESKDADEVALIRYAGGIATRALTKTLKEIKLLAPNGARPTGPELTLSTTVRDALAKLTAKHPDLKRHLYSDDGKLRAFVNVYLNDEDIRYLDGRENAAVKESDNLSIIPSIAGGQQE